MSAKLCALQLSVLLHYSWRTGDYADNEPEHQSSPAVRQAIDQFWAAGVLQDTTPTESREFGTAMKLTPKGRALVERLKLALSDHPELHWSPPR